MIIYQERAIKVAGVSFGKRQAMLYNFKRQLVENQMKLYLTLAREPKNVHDKNAIKVLMHTDDGRYHAQIGYIPKDIAKNLAKMMDGGTKVFVKPHNNEPLIRGQAFNHLGVTCDIFAVDSKPK